jgi:CubicO group peptidase (beta-lactamase class C family)
MIRHLLLLLVLAAPAAAQRLDTIQIAKMRPTGLLVDAYSYMSPPFNAYYFHNIDKLGFRLDTVRRAGPVLALAPAARPFTLSYTVNGKPYTLEEYFYQNHVTGFLILRDTSVLFERYFHGSTAESRFVSQSISKSLVAVLVGIAVDRGLIKSVDDPITRYLPELASSGYKDASVKNVLQMATGVGYSENYQDSTSGAARIGAALVAGAQSFRDFTVSMKPTTIPPGTKFEYQSVNTQALGMLVEKVTGKSLNEFASEALWQMLGAERDGWFYRAKSQKDVCAFACFNATLRDYGRFGLLMLNNGTSGGRRIVSEEWVRQSTTGDAPYLERGSAPGGRMGYGYQWWLPAGHPGVFQAIGIYGQSIWVDPANRLIIVQTSAWPTPIGSLDLYMHNTALRTAIASAVSSKQ